MNDDILKLFDDARKLERRPPLSDEQREELWQAIERVIRAVQARWRPDPNLAPEDAVFDPLDPAFDDVDVPAPKVRKRGRPKGSVGSFTEDWVALLGPIYLHFTHRKPRVSHREKLNDTFKGVEYKSGGPFPRIVCAIAELGGLPTTADAIDKMIDVLEAGRKLEEHERRATDDDPEAKRILDELPRVPGYKPGWGPGDIVRREARGRFGSPYTNTNPAEAFADLDRKTPTKCWPTEDWVDEYR